MFLGVDIGNSDIVFGFYKDNKWAYSYRLPSKTVENASFYSAKLRLFLLENELKTNQIVSVGISSVVPNVNQPIIEAIEQLFGISPTLLSPDFFQSITLKVLNPNQIGSDLVCNAMYANHTYNKDAVVFDFGTALTCTTVSATGEILGVSIAPGLKTAIKALFSQTAQLPEVPLQLPESVLGKNTVHAIQAGILWGYVGMVNTLIEKVKAELQLESIVVICTGGLSHILSGHVKELTESNPMATLEGLRLLVTKQ
jgi:type III pantothenate kinase